MHRTKTILAAGLAGLLLAACCGSPCGPCPPRRCGPPPCGPVTVVRRGPVAAPGAGLPKDFEPSGFLSNYDQLRSNPEHPGSWIWMKDGLDLRTYDRLMIDEIPVILAKEDAGRMSEDLQRRASTFFRDTLYDTISPYYEVVDKAEPHVLRVRIALTHMHAAKPEGEAVVAPGGAELEAELRDAMTDELLLSVVSRIEGSQRGGREAPEGWEAVEGAFYEWSDRLLDLMDSYHDR